MNNILSFIRSSRGLAILLVLCLSVAAGAGVYLMRRSGIGDNMPESVSNLSAEFSAGSSAAESSSSNASSADSNQSALSSSEAFSAAQSGESSLTSSGNSSSAGVSLSLSGPSVTEPAVFAGNLLVQDPSFLRGFSVTGLSTINDAGIRGYFDYDGNPDVRSLNPIWSLSPWYSKYSIGLDHVFTVLEPNRYQYEDTSKKVVIDTDEAMISLRIDASKEYTAPRTEGQAWPHLLIGQGGKGYSNSSYFDVRKISSMKELRVAFNTRLTYFIDAMGSTANPNLHGCGFYIYLYIQNLNLNDPDYGNMIWFGLPLFDNRTAWCGEFAAADGGKEDASGMFIYQIPQRSFMPASFWSDGAPAPSGSNPWISVDFNCLSYVQRALTLAKQRGYLPNTEWEDLYFNGFNIGWEMYGTYDGEIQIRNFEVRSVMGNE